MSTVADEYATFVVRLSRVDGRLGGVVERVRTGEKARFEELDVLGALIAGMLEHHERSALQRGSEIRQGGPGTDRAER